MKSDGPWNVVAPPVLHSSRFPYCPPVSEFTPISEVGEFGLIDRLASRLSPATPGALIQGIGDDAAVYRVGGAGSDGPSRVHVVTTDALVEGVHFDRTYAPLGMIGWKAIATSVSDVVAMNAEPRFATVTLGMPNNVSVENAETLYDGMAAACERYGLAIIGGDITAAPRLTLSVTVIGEADEDDIVYRRGAQVGDVLCVTGDLGSAAAGLQVLLAGKEDALATGGDGAASSQPDLSPFAYVVERQLMPQARLDRIRQWRAAGIRPTALIDVSDGLASEVHHLSQAGIVGAVVEGGFLPVHVQTYQAAEKFEARPEAYALYGGEDYELLFTMPEEDVTKLDEGTVAVVGQIVEPEDGVQLRLPDGNLAPLQAGGYKHY